MDEKKIKDDTPIFELDYMVYFERPFTRYDGTMTWGEFRKEEQYFSKHLEDYYQKGTYLPLWKQKLLKDLPEKVKNTFNLFTRVFDWGEPNTKRVEVCKEFIRLCSGKGDYDTNMVIYNNGDYVLSELSTYEIYEAEPIAKFSIEEFSSFFADVEAKFPNVLAESEHFLININADYAELIRKEDYRTLVSAGKHLGRAKDAYIDPNEKFTITVGDGIVKYEIKDKYEKFYYEMEKPYTISTGNEDNILYLEHIEKVTDLFVEVSDDSGEIHRFNLNTLERTDNV